MKSRNSLYILAVALLLIPSCEKSPEEEEFRVTELTIEVNKTKILDNNQDRIIITVHDQLMHDLTSYAEIHLGGNLLGNGEFKSSEAGTYQLYASYKGVFSDTLELTVVEDPGLIYTKRILIEQFTGTWCGYCPRAIYQIDRLSIEDQEISHVAYHLSDGFAFVYNSLLFQTFGFTGVPTVYADRTLVWGGSPTDIADMHTQVRTGIELAVAGTSDELVVDVQVTFGIIYDREISLSVYILHDDLVADQTNYYNDDPASPWYGAGSIMKDFVHKSVMIKTATDMFGDIIPEDDIDIGQAYVKQYRITNFLCQDISKIKVVAFVHYGEEMGYKVINSASLGFEGAGQ